MSVKPILFNSEMVRAVLEGRKTVTRRAVKPRYKEDEGGFQINRDVKTGEWWVEKSDWDEGSFDPPRYVNPPYCPGDILYVRETFRVDYLSNIVGSGRVQYKADGSFGDIHFQPARYDMMRRAQLKPGWRPNENMPKEAARIFLRVTDVRVQRLQEITMQDIRREGSVPSCAMCSFNEAESAHGIKCRKAIERSADCALENHFPNCGFRGTWDSTIKSADRDCYGWDANPWVWVIEFERCEKP